MLEPGVPTVGKGNWHGPARKLRSSEMFASYKVCRILHEASAF